MPGASASEAAIEEAVRDDDELVLRAQLEREVVRGRARVERNGFALVDHRRRGPSDRALPLDLQPQAEVEPELGLAALERPHASADASDEALPASWPRSLRTVTSETEKAFASSATWTESRVSSRRRTSRIRSSWDRFATF